MKNIPPNYFYAGIIGTIILFFALPCFNLIHFPYNLIGLLLFVLGIYLVIAPYYQFKKYDTPEKFEKSTCVVDGGLYKYSRNPMYVGGVVALVGLSILLGNVIDIFPK